MAETNSNATATDGQANIKGNIIWGLIGFIVGVVVAFGIFSLTMGSAANKAIDSMESASNASVITVEAVDTAA